MQNKNNVIYASIFFILSIATIILVIFYDDGEIYKSQKEKMSTYFEEEYNIKPKINYVQELLINNTYVYYFLLSYNDLEFTSYLYDDDEITDTYIGYKLGKGLYKEFSNSIKKSFNTDILDANKENKIYIGYYDETSLPANMSVAKLLKQDVKDTYLSVDFVVKNNELTDKELAETLEGWLNQYIVPKEVDYISVSINFIDESNHKAVENSNSNQYTKRYIHISVKEISKITKDVIDGAIYTTTDYIYYEQPLLEN